MLYIYIFILITVGFSSITADNTRCSVQADRSVVLAAVQRDGAALEFAACALREDKEVGLALDVWVNLEPSRSNMKLT